MNNKIYKIIFSTFYRFNLWFNRESYSGPGSTLASTSIIRNAIPTLLNDLNIKVLLDIPCGDFNWMKALDMNIEQYIGGDIVAKLIKANTQKFSSPCRRFLHLDIIRDPLPSADLILCRDCLVHLPIRHVQQALKNIAHSDASYLLTTTFPLISGNQDIFVAGQWRPLNLEIEPFCFPKPFRLINEGNEWKSNRYPIKSLGLWHIKDIPC